MYNMIRDWIIYSNKRTHNKCDVVKMRAANL